MKLQGCIRSCSRLVYEEVIVPGLNVHMGSEATILVEYIGCV